MATPLAATRAPADERPLDVTEVHARHGGFVWLSLQRLGVRDADLPDVHQEVFIVVHRRLHTFDASARMTTWLFGVALRVAAAHRRRAHVRRERPVAALPEEASAPGEGPEEAAARREAHASLVAILDAMDIEKRAVFVMAEVDELPGDEIAEVLGVPLGTVYTRLRAARRQFEAAVARHRAREHGGGR